MENIIYGYARVSTKDQNPDRQIKSLIDYGIDERNIITDICTGVNFRRNGYNALSKVLLKVLSKVLVLSKNFGEFSWKFVKLFILFILFFIVVKIS